MARYAVIIGITEYQSPNLSRLPKAATDAEIVGQLLEQYGDFQVKRLPESWTPDKKRKVGEKKVTATELGQELETLLLKRATGSDALIYFAGHGFTISDNLGEQQGFLATSDCQIEMVGEMAIAQKYGISLESLNKLIGKSDLSSLVMLLDCCHSGYFLERNLIQQTMTAFSAQKDYYLITACRSYEQAKSFKGEPHSIFTGALLKGLAAENAGSNRRVTGDRLFDFISAELKNSVQEPIRMGWGRSITLVTYPYQEPTIAEVTFNHENPYLGLRAFESDKQKYFFGRELAVRALLDRLTNNRFLAVIGPSGCGKSSLVKAGLLPQLQSDRLPGSSQWDIESLTPGKHPLGTLIEILERRNRQDKPFVLFIDQFEEVFTLCDNETERQSFIKLMADEASASDRVTRVIAAIRGDFLDRCAQYPEAVHLINRAQPTTYVVTPLTPPELKEAIEKPAVLHGVQFEGGLVSQIMEDVENQPGALPLLQYSLSELWRVLCLQESLSEPLLTWKDYEQIGRVKGALDNRATLVYRSLSADNQAFVRRLLMELVQVNEGQEVTRRRATWEELEAVADSPEQLQQVVGLLADQQQRLIITDENTVEVAHEALLSEWTLLRGWIEENRENLRIRRRLEAECREWQERYHKSDEALLTGALLAAIAQWVEKTQPKLPKAEAEFLRKSLEKRDHEIQEQLAIERQLRELAEARQQEAEARALAEIEKSLEAEARAKAEAEKAREAKARAKAEAQRTAWLGMAACGLTVLVTVAFGLKQQAEQRTTTAIKALISEPQQLFSNNNQLEAMIASVKALKQIKEIGGENGSAIDELKSSVIDKVRESNRLKAHQEQVLGVSFSPNGQTIASASQDKTVKLWNITGQLQNTLSGHTKGVWSVRFSPPDGKMLASSSFDTTVRLWSAKGEFLRALTGHKDVVYDVSFSPDSKLIATSSGDGTIKLWDTASGELRGNLQDPGKIHSVDFSKDGQTLASAGYKDGSVKVWALKKGTSIITGTPKILGRHQDSVNFVRFSPDGKILASSSDDGSINLWKDGQLLHSIKAHKKFIYGLAFSRDSETIASASTDGTIKVWKLDGTLVETLKGHSGEVYAVSFSPNQDEYQLIVSAGEDTTVRLWKIYKNTLSFNKTHKLDDLEKYTCNFIKFYLKNDQLLTKADRQACEDILNSRL